MAYTEQTFEIGELEGLSKDQIDQHLKLYAGYVKNLNKLKDTLQNLMKDHEANSYALSEVERRLGFEFNGMRLHELYFEQFEGGANMEGGALKAKIEKQWGSFDAWKAEFSAIAKMRGVGWTLLVHDAKADVLHNVWVNDHELGHLGGQPILCAMDIWEHAFTVDYAPTERGKYIDVWWANLNWSKCEERL
jgi:Fe-Mn family superoxide dismutase